MAATWVAPLRVRKSRTSTSPRSERSVSISAGSSAKKTRLKKGHENRISTPFSTPPRLHALVEAGAEEASNCSNTLNVVSFFIKLCCANWRAFLGKGLRQLDR